MAMGSGGQRSGPTQLPTLLHTHNPHITISSVDADYRKSFAIVRKKRKQRKKTDKFKASLKKKRKVAGSDSVLLLRDEDILDINLTEPMLSEKELQREIFENGKRKENANMRLSKKMQDKKAKEDKMLFISNAYQTNFPIIRTSLNPKGQTFAQSSIQPYEYPLPSLISFSSSNITQSAIFVTPRPSNLQRTKKVKSAKKKLRKNKTKNIKENKATRPIPTAYDKLE